jgi:hypothetical protein
MESANLAYSRIMIENNSRQSIGEAEERLIDEQFKRLVKISMKLLEQSFEKAETMDTKHQQTKNHAPNDHGLKLAMGAARIIEARRLTSLLPEPEQAFFNTYTYFLEIYNQEHPKHLFIRLDHLSVLLTGIQTLRQNVSAENAQQVSSIDDVAIDTAKVILTTLKDVCLSKSKVPNNSLFSEFVTDPSTQSPEMYLIREARAHYARGVSIYRPKDHVRCACWADMLIDILTILSNFDCNTHDEIESQVTAKQSNENAISELMGVKAYALAMSGNHTSAVKIAREAWNRHTSLYNLVVLFETMCKSNPEVQSASNIMLELDGALSIIQSCTESPSSNSPLIKGGNESNTPQTTQSILSVMPIIANACIKNETENKDIVLLGVSQI